jgi:hypothetical protein
VGGSVGVIVDDGEGLGVKVGDGVIVGDGVTDGVGVLDSIARMGTGVSVYTALVAVAVW